MESLFWFYRESRSFMAGFSQWHFWTRFPRAFFRFYVLLPIEYRVSRWQTRREMRRSDG